MLHLYEFNILAGKQVFDVMVKGLKQLTWNFHMFRILGIYMALFMFKEGSFSNGYTHFKYILSLVMTS